MPALTLEYNFSLMLLSLPSLTSRRGRPLEEERAAYYCARTASRFDSASNFDSVVKKMIVTSSALKASGSSIYKARQTPFGQNLSAN